MAKKIDHPSPVTQSDIGTDYALIAMAVGVAFVALVYFILI